MKKGDTSQPVTRGVLKQEFSAFRTEIDQKFSDLRDEIKIMNEQRLSDFRDVVHDSLGIVKDKSDNHDRRITTIGESLGIAA